MTFTSAPTSGNESQVPTLADKIRAIDDQIEEAHMTFDDALVAKLQAEKDGLELQEKAKQEEDASKPQSVAEVVKEGDPVKLAELDDRFAVAQPASVVIEESPVLQDAHVERRNEEIRNKFMESIISNAPYRVGDFKKIANKILNAISEEPSYTFKTDSFKSEKQKEILDIIQDSSDNLDFNCLPNEDFMNEAARAFGSKVEDMRGKVYQAIKEKAVEGGFNADVFDVLVSSDSAEIKKDKIRKLTSAQNVNPGNY